MTTPRIASRVSEKLRARLDRAIKTTGLKESEILRVAVEHFLETRKKPEEVIDAVVRSRTACLK